MALSKLLDDAIQDVRFAVRQLQKSAGFAFTAVFTLALGVCGSVAIFAFVDAALLEPLPYRNPSRLAGVFESVQMFPQSNLSYADYIDWKRLNKSFESLSAYQGGGVALNTPAGRERAPSARVSDDFFRTLGVSPMLGRDFHPGEDLPSAPRAVLISYSTWQTRYAGRAEVLGQAVVLDGAPHTIVGVLPRGFHFAPVGTADFWTTLHASNPCDLRRSCHNLYGVARLRDNVPLEAAAAEMRGIARQLEAAYPDSNRGQGAVVVPLVDVIVGRIRPLLLVLLGGAALLLAIASVNVSSLLLVRSERRKREIAVRRALGASGVRVVRQFVAEGLVLVAAGSAAGLAAAYWAIRFLTSLIPANVIAGMPYLQGLGMNARVAAFTCVIALLATALFVVTPSLHLALAHQAGEGLADGSRGAASNTWRRIGSPLVVVELATAMVLLVSAGLLGQSFYRLLRVDIGLQADHLAMLGVAAPARYSTNEQLVALERQIETQVAVLPGVQSAGISSTPPILGGNTMWIRVAGRPYHGEHNEVQYREVSPGYFATLRARLLRGRDFTKDDAASKPAVVVINRALARDYFGAEDPLGQHLLYAPTTTQPPMEVVGIVDDIKEGPVDAATRPTMYVAFAQDPTNAFAIFVRTAQAEESVLPVLTAALNRIDPDLSTFRGTSMAALINDSQAAYMRRSSASLAGGFAVASWLLSVIGLYGVIAYSVSQRTREIGVRMALGAPRASVYRLILREASRLAVSGVAIGVMCSIAAATAIRGLLFGVQPYDAATLAGVGGVLAASALLATYIPARRAASVNPIEALRAD